MKYRDSRHDDRSRVIPRILGRKSVNSGIEKRDLETSSADNPWKNKLYNLQPGDFFLRMIPFQGGNILI